MPGFRTGTNASPFIGDSSRAASSRPAPLPLHTSQRGVRGVGPTDLPKRRATSGSTSKNGAQDPSGSQRRQKMVTLCREWRLAMAPSRSCWTVDRSATAAMSTWCWPEPPDLLVSRMIWVPDLDQPKPRELAAAIAKSVEARDCHPVVLWPCFVSIAIEIVAASPASVGAPRAIALGGRGSTPPTSH